MEIKALGIELGKNWFQLHGVDKRGKAVLQIKVSRENLIYLSLIFPDA